MSAITDNPASVIMPHYYRGLVAMVTVFLGYRTFKGIKCTKQAVTRHILPLIYSDKQKGHGGDVRIINYQSSI